MDWFLYDNGLRLERVKMVVAVIEIHTLFNNRGKHTNIDANESSSSEIEKENSNDDGANENGE